MMNPYLKNVFHFIEKHQMIRPKDNVIAGVSGGADSVCLLFVLLELRKTMGIDLTAVHVNHGLRGEAAEADEMFVRTLCEKYQVPLKVFRVSLELIAKNRKQSLEEAGRTVRREAFEAAGKEKDQIRIALAHHQDDNAETFLWNLSRGSGLDGLGGIRPVNGKYIRPLLCLRREEIERFLAEQGQDFCTDATNAELDYTRNRLRHLVLPVLEQEVNSQAVRHINEAMEQIREAQEYMETQAAEAFAQCVFWKTSCEENEEEKRQRWILIRKEQWEHYPPVLQRMVLRRAVELLAGQMRDVGRTHIHALQALFGKQVGRRQDLPFSMQAVRVYEGVELSRKQIPTEENRKAEGKILCIPGETSLPLQGLKVCCSVFPKPESFSRKEIPEKIYTKWFDYDIIKMALCIRTRESGDFLTVDRAGHRQKLKTWFINNKIPAKEREVCLCIAEGKEILWILGHRMNSAYQVREHTKRILQIEIVREERRKKDGRNDSGIGIGTESGSENRGIGQTDQ